MEKYSETSEIHLFNEIGEHAKNKGYGVVYFKKKIPKINIIDDVAHTVFKYLHYVQIFEDSEMKVSIYFDDFSLSSIVSNCDFYELFYKGDVERFLVIDEEEEMLFNRVKELI